MEPLKGKPATYFVMAKSFECGRLQMDSLHIYNKLRWLNKKHPVLAGITPHSCRHTSAVNLYNQTKDIKLVQRHLRHSHVHTTDNYLRQLGVNTGALKVDWETL